MIISGLVIDCLILKFSLNIITFNNGKFNINTNLYVRSQNRNGDQYVRKYS